MLAANVDFKTFDSVHCEVFWDLMHLRWIPAGIIGLLGLLTGLYSRTQTAPVVPFNPALMVGHVKKSYGGLA